MPTCDNCNITEQSRFLNSNGQGMRWVVTVRFPRDILITRVCDQLSYSSNGTINPVRVVQIFCDECDTAIRYNRISHYLMCGSCYGLVDLRRGNGADMAMLPCEGSGRLRICRGCSHRQINRVPDCIQGYSADATELLKTKLNPNKLYSGIEIEVGFEGHDATKKRRAYEVLQKVGSDYAICKKDASISGFEIVSIPTTLDVHAKALGRLCAEVPKGLLSDTDGECGIHVHLSKAPISACTLVKLQYFINARINRKIIEKIAGRHNNHYGKYNSPNLGFKTYYHGLPRSREFRPLRKFDLLRYNADRRAALNLRKSPTIEFRIFQSSLNFVKVMSYLEFCYAAVNFCNVTPMRKIDLNVLSFANYVRNSEYKHLKQRINQIVKGTD